MAYVKKKRDGSQVVPISQVKLWDKNPRGCKKDDFARLKNQIQKFGVYKPLIACEHLNRICYGMEIEPKYCDVTIARWEELTEKKAKLVKDATS